MELRAADWPAWGPLALEAVLWVALAASAARLGWQLLESPPLPEAVPPPATVGKPASFPTTDPFHPGATRGGAVGADGYTLRGVRLGTGDASAFIADAQGRQRAWRVGEQLAPGVTLRTIGAGYVVLEARGEQRRLELPRP